jgi:PKD repeat protein
MAKWHGLWAVTSALLVCAVLPAAAEDVVELWRGGDFYENYSMSVNPIDNSVWAGNGNIVYEISNVVHMAEDGEVLWQGPPAGPLGLSVNTGDGSVWVASEEGSGEEGYGRVVHLGSGGNILWWTSGWIPNCISVDPSDGSCWVPWTHWEGTELQRAVLHLAADGSELGRVSVTGADPLSLSVDPTDGSCWVGYRPPPWSTTTVTRWSADYQILSETATDLAVEGSSFPVVAASPSDGSCWVADSEGSEVLHLRADGGVLSRHTQFDRPKGLAVNPIDGSCWIADYGHLRVVHLSSAGLELWHSSGVYGTGFDSPYAICVNPSDGSCWVGNYHGEVVHLAAMPIASFSASPTTGTVPLTVQFADLSTSATTWLWDFGDGATSAERAPAHEYASPGTYTVTLTATSRWGSDTATQAGCVLALPPVLPVADFEATPTSGSAPLEVTFLDRSTHTPASWSWDFGDGGVSADPNATHTYTVPGSYTVSLTVTNGAGSDTASKPGYITVTMPAAAADFTAAPLIGPLPLAVTFADTSAGQVSSRLWDFGDGGTSTERAPAHAYQKAGAYTVGLTVSNAGGSDTETKADYITVLFTDVAADHWAYDAVMACVAEGIVSGFPNGTYAPAAQVTRDQMAVYLARALAGGDAAVPTGSEMPSFSDVPHTGLGDDGTDSYWAYRYIEYCAAQNVVLGFPGGNYRPTDVVNRGQMAVYVARALVAPAGDAALPAPPTNSTFIDVTPDNDWRWCYQHVEYLAAEEIVQGYWDGTYRPGETVTRDQMAVYVARAFALPM